MKELMSPPACKGHWGVGAPTVLSQEPAHTQPRGLATCLCHSYTEHATTSQATLLPCGPQIHTAPLAPRHRDPCKEQPPSLDQHHHMCARMSPQPSMAESGSDRILKGIFPGPFPSRTCPDSLPDRTAAAHTLLEQPCPQGFPSDPLFTLAEASSQDPTLPSSSSLCPQITKDLDPLCPSPRGPLSSGGHCRHPTPSKTQIAGQERSPSAVTSFLCSPELGTHEQPPLLIPLNALRGVRARTQEDSSLPG